MGLIEGCAEFFSFIGWIWNVLPQPVQVLVLAWFGLCAIFGILKMLA